MVHWKNCLEKEIIEFSLLLVAEFPEFVISRICYIFFQNHDGLQLPAVCYKSNGSIKP